MTPPNPQFEAAAVEYARLRRRWWRFFLLAVGLAAVFILPAVAFHAPANSPLALVAAAGGFASGLCIVGATLSWAALMSWPCPRCGKRFILGRRDNLPTDECKHCGLDLSLPPDA